MIHVKSIQSVDGDYYEIGLGRNGDIYLRNRYTEVPNEFNLYNTNEVRELFLDLCKEIPNAEPVEFASPGNHPNSYMRVLYDNGHVQIYHETQKGKNLCALTNDVANYSEFFGPFIGAENEMITISRLRQVIKEKREYKKIFQQASKDISTGLDDYTELRTVEHVDGSWEMNKYTYGMLSKNSYISVNEDGMIVNTGGLKYSELLKEYNVRVI